ncbi:MAG TPA: hypothetical protein DCW68_07065, partial [Rhodospirillaceae bacterium]|nr:hypothetical protein [Rhodospirillaceae bacterium]
MPTSPLKTRTRGAIGGFTELLITLAVGTLVLGSLATMTAQQAGTIRNQATALQFKKVYAAGTTYIKNEYNSLMNDAGIHCVQCCGSAAQPLGWQDRFSELKSMGYLPSYFENANNYRQEYRFWVGKVCVDNKNTLAAWLVTAPSGAQSTAIPRAEIAQVASMAGHKAGYIAYPQDPAAISMTLTGSEKAIIGALGGWKLKNVQAPDQGLVFGAVGSNSGYLAAPIVA